MNNRWTRAMHLMLARHATIFSGRARRRQDRRPPRIVEPDIGHPAA